MARNLEVRKATQLLIICVLLVSCVGERKKNRTKSDQEIHEEMIEYNKNSALFEEEIIKKYIKDSGIAMARTGTGLWYSISDPGDGEELFDGQTLTIDFDVFMLNDSLCYSSKELGPNTFRLGMADVESGLHEGIKMLKEGGSATFIVPSFLAHGLLGDMNKIPPKTPVKYNIHVRKRY